MARDAQLHRRRRRDSSRSDDGLEILRPDPTNPVTSMVVCASRLGSSSSTRSMMASCCTCLWRAPCKKIIHLSPLPAFAVQVARQPARRGAANHQPERGWLGHGADHQPDSRPGCASGQGQTRANGPSRRQRNPGHLSRQAASAARLHSSSDGQRSGGVVFWGCAPACRRRCFAVCVDGRIAVAASLLRDARWWGPA
jgi:hypothetical protein